MKFMQSDFANGYLNGLAGVTKFDTVDEAVQKKIRVKEVDIECKRLDDVFDENNVLHVDYFSLDCEGDAFL